MLTFRDFLTEGAPEEGAKLKHITHAEDRPLFDGAEGFKHAYDALHGAHFQDRKSTRLNSSH